VLNNHNPTYWLYLVFFRSFTVIEISAMFANEEPRRSGRGMAVLFFNKEGESLPPALQSALCSFA
jgi:hypothetical protein